MKALSDEDSTHKDFIGKDLTHKDSIHKDFIDEAIKNYFVKVDKEFVKTALDRDNDPSLSDDDEEEEKFIDPCNSASTCTAILTQNLLKTVLKILHKALLKTVLKILNQK